MNKGGKFLKKLGCCIGGIAEQSSLVLSLNNVNWTVVRV